MRAQNKLPNIVDTRRAPRSLLAAAQRGQKQTRQNRNDRDHHEQLDQREAAVAPTAFHSGASVLKYDCGALASTCNVSLPFESTVESVTRVHAPPADKSLRV